jgi:hypothetical protein
MALSYAKSHLYMDIQTKKMKYKYPCKDGTWHYLRLNIKVTIKSATAHNPRKMKNKILAISVAIPAILVKPSNPAMMAMIKK